MAEATILQILAAELQSRVPTGFEVRETSTNPFVNGLSGPTILISGYYGSARLRYSITDRGENFVVHSLDKFTMSHPDRPFGDSLMLEWADPDSLDQLDRFLRAYGLRIAAREDA
jgi:hypothetical protein